MSWETINGILGLATTDRSFCQLLLDQPAVAARLYGFELTEDEQEILSSINACDLATFSQTPIARISPDTR